MRAPAVCLHGFTGSPASWTKAIDLAPKPCVALALPGHCGLEAGTDFRDTAARVARAISERMTPPVHLVGYSLGARIGLAMLVEHPELFASATLIGCHFGLRDLAERKKRCDRDRTWIEILKGEGIETFVQKWETLPLFATQSADQIASQRAIRSDHDPAGLARSLATAGLGEMPSYWDKLADITVPVDLVTGSRDRKFTELAVEAVSHNVRFCHRIVADVGHNVAVEKPSAVWS